MKGIPAYVLSSVGHLAVLLCGPCERVGRRPSAASARTMGNHCFGRLDAVAKEHTQCISTSQADTANGDYAHVKAALDRQNAENGCSTGSVTVEGPRIRFTMTCSDMETVTDITYFGTHSEGTMSTEMSPGKHSTMTVTSTRLGACPP